MSYEQLIDFIVDETKNQGISQVELARRTLINKATISSYFTKVRIAPADKLLLILEAIGKPLEFVQTKRIVTETHLRIGDSSEN